MVLVKCGLNYGITSYFPFFFTNVWRQVPIPETLSILRGYSVLNKDEFIQLKERKTRLCTLQCRLTILHSLQLWCYNIIDNAESAFTCAMQPLSNILKLFRFLLFQELLVILLLVIVAISFTTKDQDNDSWVRNCAVVFKGAWWYFGCHQSNLNGFYHHGKHSSYADGVNWYHWKGHYYSVKRAEMKIRPVSF